MAELEDTLAIPREEVILASAKDGTGRGPRSWRRSCTRDPAAARGRIGAAAGAGLRQPLRPVQGRGRLRAGRPTARCTTTSASASWPPASRREILELGYFRPQPVPTRSLTAGEVGYVATGLKSIAEARVGDTLTDADTPAPEPLPGYQQALPLVFAGLYPMRGDDYPLLRDALDKLHLNDAASSTSPSRAWRWASASAAASWACCTWRSSRSASSASSTWTCIASAPSVEYRVKRLNIGPTRSSSTTRPRCPTAGEIEAISEPWVAATGHHADRLHRPDHGAGDHPPRRVQQHGVPRPEARQPALRDAAGRADHRLLRPAQEPHPAGYASLDYQYIGYRPGRPGQARHAGQRRAGRRAVA